MTQNLTRLLDTIREAEKLKNTDLNDWNPRSRPGMEIARNQAIQNLPSMYDAYQSSFRHNSAAVFLTGPEAAQAEFGALAKKLGAPVLDAKAFYVDVTRDAVTSIGNSGRFTPTEFAHIMHQLRVVIYDELKVPEFMRPDLTSLIFGTVSPKMLVDSVAAAMVKANGHGFAAAFLGKLAAKEVLASGYSQDVVPVVLTGASKEEIGALSTSGQFTGRTSSTVVLDDAKVNEEYVRDVLARITGVEFVTEKSVEPEVSPTQSDPASEQVAEVPVSQEQPKVKKHKQKK